MTVVDPDPGEAAFIVGTQQGTYGRFEIDANGAWRFVLDNGKPDVQALASTDSVSETFQARTLDGSTRPVIITINGRDDGAVIGGTAVGSVTEDRGVAGGDLSVGGSLTIVDPDAGEGAFTPVSGAAGAGQYGSFTLSGDGHWSYTADNGQPLVQGLGAGQSLTDRLQITSVDGTTHDLSVTIQGTNDAPVLSAATASATEDGSAVTGQMTATDVDSGDTLAYALVQAAPAGFALSADGSWTFDPTDAAYQHLAAGATQVVTVPVTVTDGTATDTQNLTITVTGTNDRAVISAPVSLPAGQEDKAVPIVLSQLLSHATDIDTTDSLSVTGLSASHGVISGDAAHGFTFTPDANYNGPVQLAYTVTDGQGGTVGQTASLSLAAVGDPAVITDVTIPSVTEDRGYINTHYELQVYGKLSVTDPDPGEAQFDINYGPQTYRGLGYDTRLGGYVQLQQDGKFIYYIDNRLDAIQHLAAGQTATDTVTVRSVDGTPHQISITIHGTNDAPVLTAATASATEDGSAVSGQMSATDVDTGDTQAYSLGQTAPAGFTLNSDGSWSFDPTDAAYQHLAAGATQQVTIPVTVTDKAGATDTETLVITVTGTDDRTVVTGTHTGSVTEDRSLTTGGKLDITDPDTGVAPHFTPGTQTGSFGALTIDANGTWSYALDNTRPDVQAMGQGETRIEQFTVESVDSSGKPGVRQDITVTITGTDDRAVVTGAHTGSVTEDTSPTTGGKLDITDIDSGQPVFTAETQTGSYGALTIGADGTWSYALDNTRPDVQAMTTGDTHTEQFFATATDPSGGTTRQAITVTINGTDDRAVIAGTSTGMVTEDSHVSSSGMLTTGGQLTISDPDLAGFQEAFQSQSGATGNYGSFTIAPDGTWSYVADNSQGAVQALGPGQTLTDTFQVSSVDGTTHAVTVTLNGTNDVPVLSAATASATEDGSAVSGQMSATDVDTGDSQAFSLGSAAPAGFALNTDGSWTFDPTNAAYQSLAAGATQQVTVPVTVADSAGATDTQNLVITVTGTNDGPTVSGPVTLPGGTEDKAVQITAAQLLEHATDVDTGDQLSVTGLTASHGTITGDAAHGFTFTPDANYNGPVALNYTITDGHGGAVAQVASLTLAATGDAAVIGGVDTGDVTEDVNVMGMQWLQTRGQLTIADPDTGEARFVMFPMRGSYPTSLGGSASLVIGPKGGWIYDGDNDDPRVQALGAGQTLVDTVTVRSADGTTHQIQITIHGTNDAPVLSAATASATEDGSSVTGQMSATDVDTGDTLRFGLPQAAPAGFSLSADGSWSFDPTDAAYQHLAEGQTQRVTIPVMVSDGHGSDARNLVITVTGTNDGPTVSGPVTLPGGTEDTAVQITATQLLEHATDIDTGDQLSVTGLSASHGTISGDAATGFTFTPDPNYNGPVSLSYTVTDNHGGTVSQTAALTLAATGDAAVITGVGASLKEDVGVGTGVGDHGLLSAYGQFHVTDPDGASESQFPNMGFQTYTGSLGGSLQVNPDGQYIYHLANTIVDHLKTGEEAKDSFVIHSVDGTTHPVDFTIAGTNDAPVVYRNLVTKFEGENVFNGHIAAGDLDHDDSASLTFTSNAPVAGFHLNNDGSYSFDPSNAAYSHLNNGDHTIISIPITVTDSDGLNSTGSLRVQLLGRNDAPVLSSATASATEDGNSVTGQLSATDVDDSSFTLQYSLGQTAPAGFALNVNGSWSFDPTDAAYQHLAAGATQQVTIPVTVTDKAGATDTENLVITVTGTNDGPTVSGPVTLPGGTEDTAVQITAAQLLEHATDIDTGDQLSVTGLSASNGTIGGDAVHGFTFTPDPNYNGPVSLSYTVTDGHGGTVAQTASLTLAAVGDAAVIGGVDTGSVTEGTAGQDMSPDYAQPGMAHLRMATLKVDGQLTIIDPDVGEAEFDGKGIGFNYQGQFGDLLLNPDGSWHYNADAGGLRFVGGRPTTRGTAIDQLGDGETLTDTITVHSKDGTPHDIVITIHGSNDRPYCSSEVVLRPGAEDTRQTLTSVQLLGNTVDVDANDVGKLAIANLHPDHGSILDNKDGTYTFTPEKDYNGTVHFTYDVKDAHGGVTHTGATTTLSATGDAAVIGGVSTGDVTEDVAPGHHTTFGTIQTGGDLTIADPDAGEAVFNPQSSIAGSNGYGQFSVDANGHWTYVANNQQAAIQNLGPGQTLTDTFTVSSADGTTHDISVAIHGAIDDPTVGASVGTTQAVPTHASTTIAGYAASAATTSGLIFHAFAAGQEYETPNGHLVDPATATAQIGVNWGTVGVDGPVPAGAAGISQSLGDKGHIDSVMVDPADKAVQQGETLVIELHGTTTSAFLQLNGLGGQGDKLRWVAYGSDGAPVAQGVLAEDSTSNPTGLKDLSIQSSQPFAFVALHAEAPDPIPGSHHSQVQFNTNVGLSMFQAELRRFETALDLTGTTTDSSDTDQSISWRIDGLNQAQLSAGTHNPDGSWTVTQAEARGLTVLYAETQHLSVTAISTDAGTGDTAQSSPVPVTVDSTGALYSVITGSPIAHTDEDRVVPITGDLGIDTNKPVAPDFVAGNTDTPYGHFHIDTNGHWSFTVDTTKAQVLIGAGVNENVTVTTTDGATMQVQIQIAGQNDPGVMTDAAGSGVRGPAAVVGGQLQVTDIDSPPRYLFMLSGAARPSSSIQGQYGTLQVDQSTGAWTYSVDPTLAASLPAGATVEESFVAQSINLGDHSQLSLTLRVAVDSTGSANVLQAVAATDSGDVTEDQTATGTQDLVASGVLGSVVSNDPLPTAPVAGSHGTFAMTADGHWTYTADNTDATIQGLKTGDTLTDTATVTTTGGRSYGVTITIHGTDDAAVIGGVSTGTVTEDVGPGHHTTLGTISTSGDLTISDPDHGDAAFVAQSGVAGSNGYGTFNIDANGHWTYSANNQQAAIQSLNNYDQLTDTLTVTTVDGTPKTVSVTIQGTNDLPVISVASGDSDTGSVTEDAATTTTVGTLTATDIDQGDVQTWSVVGNGAGTYGSLSVDQNGQWTYTLDNSRPATDALATSQTVRDGFLVQVTDRAGETETHRVVIDVAGADDGSVITGADDRTTDEDTSIRGKLDVQAPDPSLASFVGGVQPGSYGTLLITGSGDWQYIPGSNAQSLNVGDTQDDLFRVHSADGTEHTIAIHVTGANDAPVAVAQTASVAEGSATTGHLTVSDPDVGDTHIFTASPGTTLPPGFTLHGDGSYSFDAGVAAYNGMKEGDTKDVLIHLVATDSENAATSFDLTVQVTGTNDAPRLTVAVPRLSTPEDTPLTIRLADLGYTDPDGDPLDHVTILDVPYANSQGNLYLNGVKVASNDQISAADISAGHLLFQPAPNVHRSDTYFRFTTNDGHVDSNPARANVNITSVNDAPTVSAGDLGQTDAGQPKTFDASQLLSLVHAQDIDHDTLSVASVQVDRQFGTVTHNQAGGTWTFHPAAGVHRDDIPIHIGVSDGTTTTQARASIDVIQTYVPPDVAVSVDISHGQTVSGSSSGGHSAGGYNNYLDQMMHQLQQDHGGRTVTRVHDEVKGSEHNDRVFIFDDMGHEEVNMEKGSDLFYLRGTTHEKIEGKEGRDTLILGSYDSTRHGPHSWRNIPEIKDVENIMTNDGVWVRGGPPHGLAASYFQASPPPHYEYDIDIKVSNHAAGSQISAISISHLPAGLRLLSEQGQEITANPRDGSYTIDPAHSNVTLVSDHQLDPRHPPGFETVVTSHNSGMGVQTVTTQHSDGHVDHVDTPLVSHDEPTDSGFDAITVTILSEDPDTLQLDGYQGENIDPSHQIEHPVVAEESVGDRELSYHDIGSASTNPYFDAVGITHSSDGQASQNQLSDNPYLDAVGVDDSDLPIAAENSVDPDVLEASSVNDIEQDPDEANLPDPVDDILDVSEPVIDTDDPQNG